VKCFNPKKINHRCFSEMVNKIFDILLRFQIRAGQMRLVSKSRQNFTFDPFKIYARGGRNVRVNVTSSA